MLNKAIFALDPGGQSGLAWGIFSMNANLNETLKDKMFSGSYTVSGPELQQIREISELWFSFYRSAVEEHGMFPNMVEFVCEDFVPNLTGKTGKDITVPERIQMGVEGYRMGRADEWLCSIKGRARAKAQVHVPPMILQMPQQASTLGTSKRLKEWGVWVVGREHERSAWRHVALRLATLLRQV